MDPAMTTSKTRFAASPLAPVASGCARVKAASGMFAHLDVRASHRDGADAPMAEVEAGDGVWQ